MSGERLAGEVRRTRSRLTGTVAVLLDARDGKAGTWAGDGPWITLCEDHGTTCDHATRKLAEWHLPMVEWCEDCHPPE